MREREQENDRQREEDRDRDLERGKRQVVYKKERKEARVKKREEEAKRFLICISEDDGMDLTIIISVQSLCKTNTTAIKTIKC